MAESMESSTCSGARSSYSWWQDGRITPKNSKWLQDNLTEMDDKIKSMIIIIKEDADSFAKRAEMYYKKRPELMKLVEDFNRAYRALAERYDRVTGALRQAQRTISVAFPNQIQSILPDEPPAELPVEEEKETVSLPSLYGGNGDSSDENSPLMIKEDWKHLNWLIADEEPLNLKEALRKNSEFKELEEEVFKLSAECTDLKSQLASESVRSIKAETESQGLKGAVFSLKSQVEVSWEKISILEAELSQKQEEARYLTNEINIKAVKLEFKEKRCFELEEKNKSLRFDLSKFDEEVSELLLDQHNLQNTVKSESSRAEKIETELCWLREQYFLLQEESKSLKMMATKLEEDEQRRLKHVGIEENAFLQIELSKLKIQLSGHGEELYAKEKELEILQRSFEDERQRWWAAEMACQSLKKMHSESEERSLLLELSKLGLEEENKRLYDENCDLKEKSSYFSLKITCLQDELTSLKRPKLKSADELSHFLELLSLEKGRNGFDERHQELMEQMVEMNFNVASLRAFVEDSLSENNLTSFFDITEELNSLKLNIAKLEERCEYLQGKVVKYTEPTMENGKNIVEKSSFLENSMTDTIFEWDGLEGKVKALEESCKSYFNQNCHLIAENNDLVAQVANIESHIESLEDRFSIFEVKHVITKNEKEVNDVFIKEGQENSIYFFKNKTNEKNQFVKEEHEKVEFHTQHKKSPFITLLEQLGFSLVELRARRNVLEMESEKKNDEIMLLQNKNDELLEINDRLIADLNANKQPKEALFFEKSLQIDHLVNNVLNLNVITNSLGQDMRVINENLRALQTENLRIQELDKKGLPLSNKNTGKDNKIFKLRREAEALRRREKSLEFELQKVKRENRGFEEECAAYLLDINTASIKELVFKQKAVELMIKYKSFESRNCGQMEDLREMVGAFEEDDAGIKAESLDNDAVLLKDHILSFKRKQGKNLLSQLQKKRFCQQRGKDHSPKLSSEIMDIKKVKELQKTVRNTEKSLTKKELIFDTGSVSKTSKFKVKRSSNPRLDRETKKDAILSAKKSNAVDVRPLKVGHEVYQTTKDIELDRALSNLRISHDFDSEIDEKTQEISELIDGEKSKNHSSELENEYSFDELKLQLINSESYHEWILNVSEALSSDALRLSALKERSEELKRRIEASQMSKQSSNKVTEQLKACEGVIKQLSHMNFKLTIMAESIPASIKGEKARNLITQRVRRSSEKIDGIALELKNAQLMMSELLEEDEMVAKALQRKSKFPLKDFIFGIRNDSRLLKKRPFCACMRLQTKGD